MSHAAVDFENVSKKFRLYRERNQTLKSAVMRGRRKIVAEEFWALRDASFSVQQGETFGLIGRNGSGKSTALKLIARILQPDKGKITRRGRISSMLEVGSGFHPELSGRENIYLNGAILGLTRKQLDSRFDAIVNFAEIGAFLDQPIKNYSSGMYVRLGFAVAVHTEPEILIVDEILAVGDGEFQERSRAKFRQLTHDGRTVILVSHSMSQVREMCHRVAWFDNGRVVATGGAAEITTRYEAELESRGA